MPTLRPLTPQHCRKETRPTTLRVLQASLFLLCLSFFYACGGSSGGSNDGNGGALGDMGGTWEGTWTSTVASSREGSFTARVVQSGSSLSGGIDIPYIGMDNAPLTGTVSGSQISFGDIDQTITFVGTVNGDNCSGTFRMPSFDERGSWTASRTAGGGGSGTAGLDADFGMAGVQVTNLHLTPDALVVQSHGRILIAGHPMAAFSSADDVQIVALTSNGQVEAGFGTGGVITTSVTPMAADRVCGLALDDDDGFYLCAQTGADDLVLLGYESTGEPDTDFGDHGRATIALNTGDMINAMTRTVDGSFLAAGVVSGDVRVMRLLADGSVDTSFGTDGETNVSVTGLERVAGIAVSASGRILVNGTANNDFFLLGLTTTGAVDTTFASGGMVGIDVDTADKAWDLSLLSDGRVVMAGFGRLEFMVPETAILTVLSPDGMVDDSFGSEGVCGVHGLENGIAPVLGTYLKVAVDDQDRIVMAGMDTNQFLLARFDDNGQIDTSFGGDGFQTADFASTGGWDFACTLTVQADGKVIAAGVAGSSALAIVRYAP